METIIIALSPTTCFLISYVGSFRLCFWFLPQVVPHSTFTFEPPYAYRFVPLYDNLDLIVRVAPLYKRCDLVMGHFSWIFDKTTAVFSSNVWGVEVWIGTCSFAGPQEDWK